MSKIKDIEHKLNKCLFVEIDKTKIENLYIQLFCSRCRNDYCFEGCCSQSKNIVFRPIEVFTEETIKEKICDVYFAEPTSFMFITIEEYLNNILDYDYESEIKKIISPKGVVLNLQWCKDILVYNIMTNHVLDESDSLFEYMNRPEVKENDTIELVTSNQQGYKKYKVVIDENNIKQLLTILDYDDGIFQEVTGVDEEK